MLVVMHELDVGYRLLAAWSLIALGIALCILCIIAKDAP